MRRLGDHVFTISGFGAETTEGRPRRGRPTKKAIREREEKLALTFKLGSKLSEEDRKQLQALGIKKLPSQEELTEREKIGEAWRASWTTGKLPQLPAMLQTRGEERRIHEKIKKLWEHHEAQENLLCSVVQPSKSEATAWKSLLRKANPQLVPEKFTGGPSHCIALAMNAAEKGISRRLRAHAKEHQHDYALDSAAFWAGELGAKIGMTKKEVELAGRRAAERELTKAGYSKRYAIQQSDGSYAILTDKQYKEILKAYKQYPIEEEFKPKTIRLYRNEPIFISSGTTLTEEEEGEPALDIAEMEVAPTNIVTDKQKIEILNRIKLHQQIARLRAQNRMLELKALLQAEGLEYDPTVATKVAIRHEYISPKEPGWVSRTKTKTQQAVWEAGESLRIHEDSEIASRYADDHTQELKAKAAEALKRDPACKTKACAELQTQYHDAYNKFYEDRMISLESRYREAIESAEAQEEALRKRYVRLQKQIERSKRLAEKKAKQYGPHPTPIPGLPYDYPYSMEALSPLSQEEAMQRADESLRMAKRQAKYDAGIKRRFEQKYAEYVKAHVRRADPIYIISTFKQWLTDQNPAYGKISSEVDKDVTIREMHKAKEPVGKKRAKRQARIDAALIARYKDAYAQHVTEAARPDLAPTFQEWLKTQTNTPVSETASRDVTQAAVRAARAQRPKYERQFEEKRELIWPERREIPTRPKQLLFGPLVPYADPWALNDAPVTSWKGLGFGALAGVAVLATMLFVGRKKA